MHFIAMAVLVVSIVSAETDTNSMTMEYLGRIEYFQTILYFSRTHSEGASSMCSPLDNWWFLHLSVTVPARNSPIFAKEASSTQSVISKGI